MATKMHNLCGGLIIILIDSREQNGPYIQKRLIDSGIDTEIACFSQDTGCDYLITNEKGSCAVQRKVVCSEFVSEIDEILHDIAPRLSAFSDNPCFLIEENFQINKEGYLTDRNSSFESNMLATSYFGILETLRKMGLDVYTTRDLNQSIWWMIGMHGYLGKNHYPPHKKTFTDAERALSILQCVPTIGEVRSKKALSDRSLKTILSEGHSPIFTANQNYKMKKILSVKL